MTDGVLYTSHLSYRGGGAIQEYHSKKQHQNGKKYAVLTLIIKDVLGSFLSTGYFKSCIL